MDAVIQNIFQLSAAARKVSSFNGPYIGVKYAVKNERHFTPEVFVFSFFPFKRKKGLDIYITYQQLKSNSSIPAWNRGDIQHSSKGMDGMGIIKTYVFVNIFLSQIK